MFKEIILQKMPAVSSIRAPRHNGPYKTNTVITRNQGYEHHSTPTVFLTKLCLNSWSAIETAYDRIMTLILRSFGDGGNSGKRHSRRIAEMKTARDVIRNDDNAPWRGDATTFVCILIHILSCAITCLWTLFLL